ncbi:enhancer of rudimentary homolog [Nannochloropsis oceanica]
MASRHTILLVQPTRVAASRTFFDFPTVYEAMDEVVKMYEKQLKQLNPTIPHITYDISHLLRFVDDLADISALVFDPRTKQYSPHSKEWVKSKIYENLKQQAGGGR